jgi:hypothetical protein
MNRKFEIFLTIIYVLNICMCFVAENWVACLAWSCALLTQLRIIDIINID